MSKKKRKKKHRNIPPATMLRPRLEKLWADNALLHKDEAAIAGDLNVLTKDISPELFVKTLLRSYRAASETVQSHLEDILPRWLSQSGYMDTLEELAASHALGADFQPLAITWLEATGIDPADIKKQPSLFLNAYYYDDEAVLGDKSQAYVVVTWYTDSRKRRAQGLGFLLDYNPPWDGSVKDVNITPKWAPDRLQREFIAHWNQRDMELKSISPERAKTVILTALACNREFEVRLSRDTAKEKDTFEKHILSLPNGPDTPAFTMKDFDFLALQGKPAEEIMEFEQTVGRRIRLEDGEEIVLIGAPWDDEDEFI